MFPLLRSELEHGLTRRVKKGTVVDGTRNTNGNKGNDRTQTEASLGHDDDEWDEWDDWDDCSIDLCPKE